MVEEYPRNLLELEAKLSTEEACREYLFRLRWPNGFRCPRCDNASCWPIGEFLYRCTSCRSLTSVTAGTIFQDTHTPLTIWFRAIWWVTTQKNGASALGLQRILGLKSYETAWTWLHKFRRTMIRPGREFGVMDTGGKGRGYSWFIFIGPLDLRARVPLADWDKVVEEHQRTQQGNVRIEAPDPYPTAGRMSTALTEPK